MKKFLPFVLFVVLVACRKHNNTSSSPSQWVQTSSFIGNLATDPVGFGIGNRIYIGMGSPSLGAERATQSYGYDIGANSWFQVASFPNPTIAGSGVGFAIGATGYVLLAKDTLAGELWAYDTAQNVWTKMADFPGRLTDATTGFSVNGKAYVGFGDTSDARQFYQYDPASNAWSAVSDFPGAQTGGTASFVIGGYAYIGLGGNLVSEVDQAFYAQVYRYDAANNSWRGCAVFPGAQRFGATGFSVGNMGYIAGGIDVNGKYLKDVWQYDPAANAWTRESDFPGSGRVAALGFSGSAAGYFGCGIGASAAGYPDLWKFTPTP